jgi:tRNA-specific 2-thiouridylase
MTRLRVLAAMSGGVDSAVAAARAAEAGHDVTGVHLALSKNPSSYRTGARGCCTLEDARDARRAADVIGIPFYVWDLAERFHREVVQDFVDEYARGNTPNPCLRCNEKIKFAAVLDRAVALGFDAVCTGHHARLVPGGWGEAEGAGEPCAAGEPGQTRAAGEAREACAAGEADAPRAPRLARSVDPAKDQSYVLAVLTSEQLARAMFPLGDSTKDQVRKEAADRGLAVADKPDSHDVCFIADGDTRKFLEGRLGTAPGAVLDTEGTVVGRHNGSYGFTVGQRKGLHIGTPTPDGRPRYVLDIEPASRTVTVGPAEALDVLDIEAQRAVWSGCTPPTASIDCVVQLRAHGEPYPATARADGDELRIRLAQPARGVARGQAAVLYDGDVVIGSATITRAHQASALPRLCPDEPTSGSASQRLAPLRQGPGH